MLFSKKGVVRPAMEQACGFWKPTPGGGKPKGALPSLVGNEIGAPWCSLPGEIYRIPRCDRGFPEFPIRRIRTERHYE